MAAITIERLYEALPESFPAAAINAIFPLAARRVARRLVAAFYKIIPCDHNLLTVASGATAGSAACNPVRSAVSIGKAISGAIAHRRDAGTP